MIIAPYNTNAFYTGVFEKAAALPLAKAISEDYFNLIEQVYVISTELSNDIEPSIELTNSLTLVQSEIDSPFAQEISYNPAYLPWNKSTLDKDIGYDEEGNIASIAGFNNPYITLSLIGVDSDNSAIFNGIVSFKPFDLPTSTELLSPVHGFMHS